MRLEVGEVRVSGSCWRIGSHFAPSCSQYSVSQKETACRSDELHSHALLSCGSVSFSLIAFRVLWKRKSAGNCRAMLWSVKGSIQSLMHLLTPFFSSVKQPRQALNTNSLIYHMLSQSSSWMPYLIMADNKAHLLICFHSSLILVFFSRRRPLVVQQTYSHQLSLELDWLTWNRHQCWQEQTKQ